MFTSAVHAAALHNDMMTMGLPQPSHQGGGWGNPVSPFPNRRWERLALQQAGVRFDKLTTGGETRLPRCSLQPLDESSGQE